MTSDRRELARKLSPPTPDDLREARRLLGLTQRGLAAELGVGHGSVSDWERGRSSPGADNLKKLVELLLRD